MNRRNLVLADSSLLALPTLGGSAFAQEAGGSQYWGICASGWSAPRRLRPLGNSEDDITLTELFDYNCPFCRKMVEPMHRLILEDKNLRVVFREWPVFGEDSDFAARASLASLPQGKYWQLHTALFRTKGRVTEDAAMKAAREVGLDIARLERDMAADPVERHITMSYMLAEHMGLMGTPSFIAGDEGAFGEYSLDQMRGMVRRARETMGD